MNLTTATEERQTTTIYEPPIPAHMGASIRIVGRCTDGQDGRVGVGTERPNLQIVHDRVRPFLNHRMGSGTVSVLVPDITTNTGNLCTAMPYTKKFYGEPPLMVHYGAAGDGVIIPRSQMGYIAAADCPLVLVRFRDILMMLHGSRHALMDDRFILTGTHPRAFESVLEAALKLIVWHFGNSVLQEVSIYSCLSVHPSEYCFSPSDEQYGAVNQVRNKYIKRRWPEAVVEDMYLDLPTLIGQQAQRYGVPKNNIHSSPLYTNAEGLYSSLRDGEKRNSVIVYHRA